MLGTIFELIKYYTFVSDKACRFYLIILQFGVARPRWPRWSLDAARTRSRLRF